MLHKRVLRHIQCFFLLGRVSTSLYVTDPVIPVSIWFEARSDQLFIIRNRIPIERNTWRVSCTAYRFSSKITKWKSDRRLSWSSSRYCWFSIADTNIGCWQRPPKLSTEPYLNKSFVCFVQFGFVLEIKF